MSAHSIVCSAAEVPWGEALFSQTATQHDQMAEPHMTTNTVLYQHWQLILCIDQIYLRSDCRYQSDVNCMGVKRDSFYKKI